MLNSIDVKFIFDSVHLGGYYPPRPTASTDNTLLDLHNSSLDTQPHSLIVNTSVVIKGSLGHFCSSSRQVQEIAQAG